MAPTQEPHVRDMRPADADSVARIYNAAIASRQATFETQPRSAGAVAAWLGEEPGRPILVAERDGTVIGWARTTPTSARPAYTGVRECSVYVDPAARGRGAGGQLLTALAEQCAACGDWKLLARVFPDNAASRALLDAGGFREVGVHRRHGRLDGEWRDVVLLERLIGTAAQAAPTTAPH